MKGYKCVLVLQPILNSNTEFRIYYFGEYSLSSMYLPNTRIRSTRQKRKVKSYKLLGTPNGSDREPAQYTGTEMVRRGMYIKTI